jgi:hypothetical protein
MFYLVITVYNSVSHFILLIFFHICIMRTITYANMKVLPVNFQIYVPRQNDNISSCDYGEVVREPVANRAQGRTRTTRISGVQTHGVVDKLVTCTHYSFSSVKP